MISRYALASVSGISGMIGIGFGESSSNGLVIEHYARFVWNYEQIPWGKKNLGFSWGYHNEVPKEWLGFVRGKRQHIRTSWKKTGPITTTQDE